MKKIAIFIAYYSIDNSPSIINLLEFLSESYEIDLFLRSVSLKTADVLRRENIRVIDMGGGNPSGFLKEKAKSYFTSYNHYICIDPHGFVLCKALFPKSRPIYYSLELYMKDDHFGLLYPKHVFDKERSQINDIKGLIIQSEEKDALFRKDYNLSGKIPSLILPVTYKGPSVKEKSDKIREMYKIDSGKKIALHLGGIAEWFSCIELAMAFSKLDNWVLFFQGYSSKEYLEKLNDTLRKNNVTNVIITHKIYDSFEELGRIIQSCDLGIAWYNDISIGFRTAGRSSGKIAAYFKFGLPVIAKKYPSTVDAIDNTGSGICVNDIDDMKDAVSLIEKDYARFSRNARQEYEKAYRFENYKEKLMQLINLDG